MSSKQPSPDSGQEPGNQSTERAAIPDVQSYSDTRNVAIYRVGIKDIRHPVAVADASGKVQNVVANWQMTVALPADRKGTHMSRFSQLLTDHQHTVHSLDNFGELFREMNRRLESTEGSIDVSFTWFIDKQAPVSGVSGLLDYEVSLHADIERGGDAVTSVQVVVPVTTLCPCSKEISAYGAHNQRSHVTIEAWPQTEPAGEKLFWEDLIRYAEEEASSELYSQLKRSDEKFVTERAYDNPKFVEDLIRDIAIRLNADQRIARYILEVENFESIHNHSAYAMVLSDDPGSDGAS